MNPFIKKGLQSLVDGAKPEDIRNMLEIEAAMSSKRHKIGAAIFDSAGGTASTMGIVGTVIQENVSPTTLKDTLKGFLDKKEQAKLESRYFGESNKEDVKSA